MKPFLLVTGAEKITKVVRTAYLTYAEMFMVEICLKLLELNSRECAELLLRLYVSKEVLLRDAELLSSNMTVENFKYAVGRSWDASTDVKISQYDMGVHNGDFIHILEKMEYNNLFRNTNYRAKIGQIISIILSQCSSN
jgi:hypothetical protein